MKRYIDYIAWKTAKVCLTLIGLGFLLLPAVLEILVAMLPGYLLLFNGIYIKGAAMALPMLLFFLSLLLFHLIIAAPYIWPIVMKISDVFLEAVSDKDSEVWL